MFDFLKKGKAKDQASKEPPKTTEPTKKVEGNDFASQEESLKPKDEKDKKGGGILGALATIRNNIDNSAIGKAFGSPGWYKSQWQGVEDAAKMATLNHTMKHYREPFRAFCVKQWGLENLDCYTALTEKKIDGRSVDPKEIYETFFAPDAPREVNVAQGLLKDLHALAKDGKFGSMDFSPTLGTIEGNLSDTWARFSTSDDLKRWLFQKMTGVASPKKVGGVKGE